MQKMMILKRSQYPLKSRRGQWKRVPLREEKMRSEQLVVKVYKRAEILL